MEAASVVSSFYLNANGARVLAGRRSLMAKPLGPIGGGWAPVVRTSATGSCHAVGSSLKEVISDDVWSGSKKELSGVTSTGGIPVIDFSKLEGDERAKIMAQIANGCEEWGFFQLVNHGIPTELLERVKQVCSECYMLERQQGFQGSKPVQLLKELVEEGDFGRRLEDVDWEDVFTLEDGNQWPSIPPEFKETMREYRAELKKLAEKMMEVMDENLGLTRGYVKRSLCNGGGPFFGTKVSHYPPCPHPAAVHGLRAHTDAGGLILLFQDDEVSGLQILKSGRWIDVQPVPNAIVINTGDQIEVLTNGRYKSVWHRVLGTPDGNRRSIASFYNPASSAIMAPAKELVDEEGSGNRTASSYPSFEFGDYMAVYANQKFMEKEPRFHAATLRAIII